MPPDPVPETPPPPTYWVDPIWAAENLDYEDMVLLAEAYVVWAVQMLAATPQQRTEMMLWSSDFEGIADWVGPGWRASAPVSPRCLSRFMAQKMRRTGISPTGPLIRYSEWRSGAPKVFQHILQKVVAKKSEDLRSVEA